MTLLPKKIKWEFVEKTWPDNTVLSSCGTTRSREERVSSTRQKEYCSSLPLGDGAGRAVNRYRSQVTEVINRHVVVSLALEQGFNAFLPVYDGGVDFILYHEENGIVRKVQLKGRWTIDKKYIGRDIWIAFPIGSDWFLMPHDEMLNTAEHAKATETASWIEGGAYSRPRPSAATIAQCAPYKFAPIAEVAADAASGKPVVLARRPDRLGHFEPTV